MVETIASAVEEGKAAVDLSPNNVAARETLGVIYRDIRGMVKGSLDYGIKNFEEALRLEPNNPILLTELGKLKLEEGDKEEAKRLFEEALRLKPNYPYAGLELSLINEVEGEMEKAIERLENLAKIYPYEEILFHLGRVYYNSEQTDKAIAQFQEALKIAPNYTNAHYSLGLAYQRIGNKEEALKEFQEALRLSPGEESIMRKIEEIESGEENIEGEIEPEEIEEETGGE